jgi:oligoendopeptidase F
MTYGEIELTHRLNDAEHKIARMKHRIEQDVALLRDGLAALRRDKPHVMIDHAERVISSLSAEIED